MTNSDPNSTPPEKRRRGAPKGNLNALKTGFYSKRFRREEMRDLVKDPNISLRSEASLLRVVMRRAVDLCMQSEDPKDYIALLRAVTDGSYGVSRLLKAEMLFGEHPLDTLDDLMAEGLRYARQDLGISDEDGYYQDWEDIIEATEKPVDRLYPNPAEDLDAHLRFAFYHWLWDQEPETASNFRRKRRRERKALQKQNNAFTVEGLRE